MSENKVLKNLDIFSKMVNALQLLIAKTIDISR